MLRALLACSLAGLALASPQLRPVKVGKLQAAQNSSSAIAARTSRKPVKLTFPAWYEKHTSGRGIWKWNNVLAAYQRHFGPWAGYPISFVEVGVQSGGSVDMWEDVLGSNAWIYGIDINPAVKQFGSDLTKIVIGDEGDPSMWNTFYEDTVRGAVDAVVDDGGHKPHQMLSTLAESFWNLKPGGILAFEDMHGEHYIDSFFVPAAHFLAEYAKKGFVDSVHIYPFLLMIQRAGKREDLPKSELSFPEKQITVADFQQMWAAVPTHTGGAVILENPTWGPFLTAEGMSNFFRHFSKLHSDDWYDVPAGCQSTSAPVCSSSIQNSDMQAFITGVHIYPERLVVEVAPHRTSLQAVRRGSKWIAHGEEQ